MLSLPCANTFSIVVYEFYIKFRFDLTVAGPHHWNKLPPAQLCMLLNLNLFSWSSADCRRRKLFYQGQRLLAPVPFRVSVLQKYLGISTYLLTYFFVGHGRRATVDMRDRRWQNHRRLSNTQTEKNRSKPADWKAQHFVREEAISVICELLVNVWYCVQGLDLAESLADYRNTDATTLIVTLTNAKPNLNHNHYHDCHHARLQNFFSRGGRGKLGIWGRKSPNRVLGWSPGGGLEPPEVEDRLWK